MSGVAAPLRGACRVVTVSALLAALTLTSCSWFRHGNAAKGCREPQFNTNTTSLPSLRVPEGLDPPDTHNGVKIPQLTSTERVRGKDEPCLSLPPDYGNPVATPGMLQPPPGPLPPGSQSPASPGRTGQRPGRGGRAPPN